MKLNRQPLILALISATLTCSIALAQTAAPTQPAPSPTAFSIQVPAESTQQSGIFAAKMPPSTDSNMQDVDRECSKDTGYRGIWYPNQPTHDQYVWKYSGGLATYPQQQEPIAIYAPKVNKTFFVYGGTTPDSPTHLLEMVSYYDHTTGMVPRPTILMGKGTDDAHDNSAMTIDDDGYIWIFSSAHGTVRPSYIHRSTAPYSIDAFTQVLKTNFSYSEPWYISGQGFLFLHTRYENNGRSLYWMTSKDGYTWSDPHQLARIDMGHYQISLHQGNRVATFFNYHPSPLGLNARTNLYYLETTDFGVTWRNIHGQPVSTPITTVQNPALIHDYQAEHLLVFLKDLQFDVAGHPVILYLTTRGWQPGPANGPRTFRTARWTGTDWQILPLTTTDHNYDYGDFFIEPDGTWRVFATSDPGPFPWGTGGEIVMFTSRDQGHTWASHPVTSASKLNQSYPRRPVDANPAFYSLWADGNPLEPSPSSLYFTNKNGSHVWRLPTLMTHDFQPPDRIR